jgi:23S rRNA pseudouridine2605 synthase
MALERLQKIIARAGIASRRKVEEMILQGRVSVNGAVERELGSKADAATAQILVDGKPVHAPRHAVYIALNKPRGCVTTLADPEGRPTVMDYLKRVRERVYPVGRLDFHTEGLLLLTNDGEFANRVMAAAGVPKTYWVKVAGRPDPANLDRLRQGIMLEGRRTRPAEIRYLPVERTRERTREKGRPSGRESDNPWLEVVLREGRQNQIRRMFERIGNPVRKLKRVQIGPVELGSLPLGAHRPLTEEEIEALRGKQGAGTGRRGTESKERYSSRTTMRRSSHTHRSRSKSQGIRK